MTPKDNPITQEWDEGVIGCCGGGLQRHEVCSHVKEYIHQQRQDLLREIEQNLPEKIDLLQPFDESIPKGDETIVMGMRQGFNQAIGQVTAILHRIGGKGEGK